MLKISVIIPVWNREALITRAIASVAAQDYPVHELIIIDDGSTDTTPVVIDRIMSQKQYPTLPISYHYIAHTGMVGKVRNYGIHKATGEWIAFLDSDDEWLPNKLSTQAHAVESHTILCWHTREQWIRLGKEISQKTQRHTREGDIFSDALKKCIIAHQAYYCTKASLIL